MEAEVQLKQWKRLAEELEICEKKLSSKIAGLDDLYTKQHSREVRKKLREQRSFLNEQAGALKDLAAVLEQAGYLYEKTEEAIIQAAETDARQYEETLRAVSLKEMAGIRVTLK